MNEGDKVCVVAGSQNDIKVLPGQRSFHNIEEEELHDDGFS